MSEVIRDINGDIWIKHHVTKRFKEEDVLINIKNISTVTVVEEYDLCKIVMNSDAVEDLKEFNISKDLMKKIFWVDDEWNDTWAAEMTKRSP